MSSQEDVGTSFQWTPSNIALSLFLFVLAGFAEIGGGYLVWQALRGKPSKESDTTKIYLNAIFGCIILILYGFIPCLQPTDEFGRIYAAYGGFFIILSFCFGYFVDGMNVDRGDLIGGFVTIIGVCVIMFYPRSNNKSDAMAPG